MKISENLKLINERIEAAAAVSGREKEDIKTVAVTKTVDTERIKEAAGLGITLIGENRVQDIVYKYEELRHHDLKWHMIGHLQRNKVRHIIDKVSLIHSVDSVALATEINKRAERIKKTVDVLLQINISGEGSKFGIKPGNIYEFLNETEGMNSIHIRGLMTIAPFTDRPEETRPVFRKLKEIFESIKAGAYNGVDMEYLSMGMTGDFEIAIEEGANIIRIGTGIFGKRL